MDFNTSVAPPSQAPLDLKTPSVQVLNPLDIAGKYQELQNSQVQNQALQQQMQTAGLQQQQAAMDLQQRQAINDQYRQAYTPGADGTYSFDQGKFSQGLAQAGYGSAIPAIVKANTEYQTSLNGLAESKQKLAAAEADTAGSLGNTVKAAGYDPAIFHAQIQHAIQRGLLDPQYYAPIDQKVQAAMQQDPTGQASRQLVQSFADQMIAHSTQQTELAKDTAQANLDTAKATREKMVNDLIAKAQQASANGENPVDTIFPASLDPQINTSYKTAFQSAMSQPPDENGRHPAADSILQAAAQHAATFSTATNPAMQKAKADEAAAIQVAQIPGEVQKAVLIDTATFPMEMQKQFATAKAMRSVGGDEFAGVPVGLQPEVIKRTQGIDNDYIVAKAASEQVAKVIQIAQQGGPLAAANVGPLFTAATMATQGFHRIPPAAMESNEAAGSIVQDIEGKLQKWGGKGPIPPALLDQFQQLNGMMQGNSYQTYLDRLSTMKREGANPRPLFQPPAGAAKVFPQAQVHAYGVAHNLSDAAAQDAIQSAGYTVK